MTNLDNDDLEVMANVRRSLTLTEIGVIASLLLSAFTGVFTLGVIYGDVQRNKDDIATLKPQVANVTDRLARIETKIDMILADKEMK